jgi:endonuclease YncB( thermonuclease family)
MIKRLFPLLTALLAVPAFANEISGKAEAVDPTVIAINGQRIMLFGIDSVMRKQVCNLGGKIWQCWPTALRNLEILLDQGPVRCDTVGEPDVYGRLLARCDVNGQSLNEQLVCAGWAIERRSETTDYVAERRRPRRRSWASGRESS